MTEPTTFPATIPVKNLDIKCEEYSRMIESWKDLDILSRSGCDLKLAAQRFLMKRPKELPEVYSARVNRVSYQNIIGTCLGYYQSATFKDEPEINFRRGGSVIEDSDDKDFFNTFRGNCDRAGTTFLDFWRNKVYPDLLRYGTAYVLTDLPRSGEFATLAEQKQSGALNPYLVSYSPLQVINWETDQFGSLEWLIIEVTNEVREFAKEPRIVDIWYYFDRQNFAVYKADRKEKGGKAESATLFDAGRHALADQNRVPVRKLEVSDDMDLGQRVYLDLLAHFNMRNAYYFGLNMACLPLLYVKGEFDGGINVSETSYIALSEGGEIGYIEPEGKSFEIASNEISALREDIYRQFYLISQGRDSKATPGAQSGYSKEIDMAPTQDALNSFGKVLRAGMVNVGLDVAVAHGEAETTTEVIGFDFEDDDTKGDIATVQMAGDLNIPSDTLDKELKKEIARKLLKGRLPEVIQAVEAEIDAAPTKSEQDALEAQQQQQRFAASLDTAVARQTDKTALSET